MIEYEETEGGFIYKGLDYDNLVDLLQCGVFNLCACGSPEDNLDFIKAGLDHIRWRTVAYDDYPTFDDYWAVAQEKEKELFGSEQGAYFFYYWADKEKLTEHGGSVPGWVSEYGEEIYALIDAALVDEDDKKD